ERRRGRLEDARVEPVEPGADFVEELFAGRPASRRCRVLVRGRGFIGRWLQAARIGEEVAFGIDNAKARFETALEVPKQPLGAFGIDGRRRRQRRREEARLLDHAALLRAEQPMLEDIEKEKARERQEDEQKVEREEAERDPGESLHGSASPGS